MAKKRENREYIVKDINGDEYRIYANGERSSGNWIYFYDVNDKPIMTFRDPCSIRFTNDSSLVKKETT
jgi:hypothetical protein